MSSVWILIALASTAASALVNTLDSHFLTRRMPSLRSYLLVIGAFTILVGLVLLITFPPPHGIGWQPLALALLSNVLRVVAVSLLLYAMKKEDVARIMPIGSTAPIFVAVMAALFLGERLEAMQWLAIAVVVTGAVLISFKREVGGNHRFHASSFFMLLGSAAMYAAADVSNKYVLDFMSYWTSVSLSLVITSGLFILFCWRRCVVEEIRGLGRPWQTVVLVNLNQLLAIAAMAAGFWAIQNGPVSLASTVFNSKPLFVFLYAVILGYLAPGFLLNGSADRQSLALKLTATVMIVGGLAVIVLV